MRLLRSNLLLLKFEIKFLTLAAVSSGAPLAATAAAVVSAYKSTLTIDNLKKVQSRCCCRCFLACRARFSTASTAMAASSLLLRRCRRCRRLSLEFACTLCHSYACEATTTAKQLMQFPLGILWYVHMSRMLLLLLFKCFFLFFLLRYIFVFAFLVVLTRLVLWRGARTRFQFELFRIFDFSWNWFLSLLLLLFCIVKRAFDLTIVFKVFLVIGIAIALAESVPSS